MKRLLVLVVWSASAFAEAPWLATHGRMTETRLEVFGGTRSLGLGVVRPDKEGARAGWEGELAFGWLDRTLDLRGARVWQLTPTQAGTASVLLGGSATVVPEGGFDTGIGPHAGLMLSLGNRTASFDLSLLTGAELFFRHLALRLPQRLGVGLNLRLAHVNVAVMLRGGVDVVPNQPLVGRGELLLSIGWLGLDDLLRR